MVRMYTRRRKQVARMRSRQSDGLARAFLAGTRDDHLHHAGLACAFQDLVAIGVETVVGEIDADVDELH